MVKHNKQQIQWKIKVFNHQICMAVSICVLCTHAFLIKKQNMFIHQQWYNVELWHEVKNKFLGVFKLLACYCWDLGTVNQYSQVFSEFSKVLYFNILLRFFTLSNLTSWDSCVEMFLCVQRATLWGVFWKSSSPASVAVPYAALVMLTFKPRLYSGHVTNALNVCFPKFDLVHTLDTFTLTW